MAQTAAEEIPSSCEGGAGENGYKSTSTSRGMDIEFGGANGADPPDISDGRSGPPLDTDDCERPNLADVSLLASSGAKGNTPPDASGYGWLPGWHGLWIQGMGEFIIMRYYICEWLVLIAGLFLALMLRLTWYQTWCSCSSSATRGT